MKNFYILLLLSALGISLTSCGGVIYGDDYYGGPDVGIGFFGDSWGGGGWGHGHSHGGGHGHGGGHAHGGGHGHH